MLPQLRLFCYNNLISCVSSNQTCLYKIRASGFQMWVGLMQVNAEYLTLSILLYSWSCVIIGLVSTNMSKVKKGRINVDRTSLLMHLNIVLIFFFFVYYYNKCPFFFQDLREIHPLLVFFILNFHDRLSNIKHNFL